MSAYPYAFRMMGPEKLASELELAKSRVEYWSNRLDTLEKIKKLATPRYERRDTFYTRDDLEEADRVEQQAAELEEASKIEARSEDRFDKVEWFLGRGENFPYFLTRTWRVETFPDFTKRRHADELYDKYREIVKDFMMRGQRAKAEEMVGDFLMMLNRIAGAKRPRMTGCY